MRSDKQRANSLRMSLKATYGRKGQEADLSKDDLKKCCVGHGSGIGQKKVEDHIKSDDGRK